MQENTNNNSELLKNVQRKGAKKTNDIVYGVYDNKKASLLTRINDFFIDHQKVSLKEKAYFFHLMSVMLDAGIPMLQTLQILSNKTESMRFQRVLNTLSYSASSGFSLADAMSRFQDVFTDAEIGVIRAGEAAGNLNKMLTRLSEQTEKSHDLQTKLITAATYPIVILTTLLLIGAGMMVWIVPVLTNLLVEGGLSEDEFPGPTKALIALSGFISNYWWLVILMLMVLYGLYYVYRGTNAGRFNVDYMKLRIPVIGGLIRKVIVLRFVSLLGILIESGLPVIKSLQILMIAINNELYRVKTWDVIKKVQAGEKISDNLADAPFLFPETVTQMINIGENTASIGLISQKIAEHYDREIDNSLKRLTTLFEPLMLLTVGIIVALLALSILMPIFDLTRIV